MRAVIAGVRRPRVIPAKPCRAEIRCSYLIICEDHADSHILALKPGEKQSVGECFFFKRFE
jgi:hypothetical protein